MKKLTQSGSESDASPCWADLSADQRNSLIGNLIGGNVIRSPYLARDGKYLWRCPITAEEAAERGKWLAEQQATEEQWKKFRKDFDDRITAEDRGRITIEIEERHLRYSDTPAGGWMVIEAIRKAGCAIKIESWEIGSEKGWWVEADDMDPHHGRKSMDAPTMADAACQVALLILPNDRDHAAARGGPNPT